MILAQKGKLSVAQAITFGADENSTNIIEYAAVDYAAMTDLWWVVDTNVKATGSGSLKFELVMATDNTLGTSIQVCCVEITGITDKRVAKAGRHIVSINVGKTLKEMLEEDGSDKAFIGQKNTLGGSALITINASLSPTEPPTLHHKMVIVSPVGIPAIASIGSGEV